MDPKIEFYTNAPIIIYIASALKGHEVLDQTWKDT